MKKKIQPGHVRTKFALSRQLGVSRNTLDKFLSMPDAPEAGPQGYDMAAVATFIAKNASNQKTLAAIDPTIRGLKQYELALRCAKLRHAIEKERGLYLLKQDVSASVRSVGVGIRIVLEQKLEREYPAVVAGLNDVPSVREYTFKLIDEILEKWRALENRWQVRDANEVSPLPKAPTEL